MEAGDDTLLNVIRQYQNSIIKHSGLGNDAKILHYISKLYDMPITVAHLQETGIGRTVNSLRKYNGNVGNAARAIVYKWKNMVAKEEDEDVNNEAEAKSPPPSPDDSRKSRTDYKDSMKSNKNVDSPQRSVSSQEDSSSSRYKSHKTERKSDSHRSSHTRESEHRSHSSDSRKHRHEEKSRNDKKRKYKDDEKPSRSTKRRYESDNASSEESDGPSMEPDSSCYNDSLAQDDDYEDIQQEDCSQPNESPVPDSSHKHKKHHKNDKHRKYEDDRDGEKHVNGNSSEKKSRHRDSKHSSEKVKKEKNDKYDTIKVKSEPLENGKESEKSHVRESKSSSKKSNSTKITSPSKIKKEILIDNDNGIDSGSGASFAEALGMMEPTSTTKSIKKRSSALASPVSGSSGSSKSSKSPKSTPSSSSSQNPDLLSPNIKLEPLEINISTQLPEITTNYKPLNNYSVDAPGNYTKHMTEEEALTVVISSKTQRTKVFSGNKTNWGFVPTLFNLCVKVLQDNIDSLEYTGGVPYEILKPVLERATANQLLNAEYHNPYLIEESDELWELHCKRECRGMQRQEMESWRDMYLRCRDERDAKLRALTVNIKQSIDKSLPVRQTKLAYVDSVVKPPRGVARKQAKYGTDKKPMITPSARLNSLASSSSVDKVSVPNPGARAATTSGGIIKPKKAPLMQKTLALIKSRFRR